MFIFWFCLCWPRHVFFLRLNSPQEVDTYGLANVPARQEVDTYALANVLAQQEEDTYGLASVLARLPLC